MREDSTVVTPVPCHLPIDEERRNEVRVGVSGVIYQRFWVRTYTNRPSLIE